ncbi:p21-C-terminal region-binding protein [Spironucleus salmonicida]|uniref:P21-C-terminal region-binding protein n=1 Tax=Spironucleus salmonicida TaxID=348837 RepID=V6M7M4_9EUKA|nr:p21-C-terminal region-binding protein [Spironucleus salmonicida]|eukprot:EST49469.1 Hypothetical protein SS50377_10218 [Spironucleus salmonicida]
MENFDFEFIDIDEKNNDDIDILFQQKYKKDPFMSVSQSFTQSLIKQKEVGCISMIAETPILACSAISIKFAAYDEYLSSFLKYFPASSALLHNNSVLLLESLRAFNLPMQAVLAGYQCVFEDLKWVQSNEYNSTIKKDFFNCDFYWIIASCKNNGKQIELESLKQIEVADIMEISKYQKLYKKCGFDENDGIISLLVERNKLEKLIYKLSQ